jgi:excisionase family DNA binding protein
MAGPKMTPFQKAISKALIPPDVELFTVEDVSRVTRQHLMTVYAQIRRGLIPCIRPGGGRAVRVRRSDLESFLSGRGEQS